MVSIWAIIRTKDIFFCFAMPEPCILVFWAIRATSYLSVQFRDNLRLMGTQANKWLRSGLISEIVFMRQRTRLLHKKQKWN